jgi:hypothetical protein
MRYGHPQQTCRPRSDRCRPFGRKPRRSPCPGAYQEGRSASNFGPYRAAARSRPECRRCAHFGEIWTAPALFNRHVRVRRSMVPAAMRDGPRPSRRGLCACERVGSEGFCLPLSERAVDTRKTSDANNTLTALNALRRGGRLLLMGSMSVKLPIDDAQMLGNNWSIIGDFMYPKDAFRRLTALLSTRALDVDRVEITTFLLAELPAAVHKVGKLSGRQAAVLTM